MSFRDMVNRIRGTVNRIGKPYDVLWREDPRFVNAEKWAKKYTPLPGQKYTISLEYARQYYEIVWNSFGVLDTKADWLIKHTSSLAVLIAVIGSATSFYGSDAERLVAALSLPSVMLFIAAAAIAVRAYTPAAQAGPASPAEILRITEDSRIKDEDQVRALVAASLHCAALGLSRAVDEKSDRVLLASWCLITGLGFLLLPVIGSLFCS